MGMAHKMERAASFPSGIHMRIKKNASAVTVGPVVEVLLEGDAVGLLVGCGVGLVVGFVVGLAVGFEVGLGVRFAVGLVVGVAG